MFKSIKKTTQTKSYCNLRISENLELSKCLGRPVSFIQHEKSLKNEVNRPALTIAKIRSSD